MRTLVPPLLLNASFAAESVGDGVIGGGRGGDAGRCTMRRLQPHPPAAPMTEPSAPEITQLLLDWSKGDRGALGQLAPVVYGELRRRAAGLLRRERTGHTFQPTDLIHEAFLRLVDQRRVQWQNRAHFFA